MQSPIHPSLSKPDDHTRLHRQTCAVRFRDRLLERRRHPGSGLPSRHRRRGHRRRTPRRLHRARPAPADGRRGAHPQQDDPRRASQTPCGAERAHRRHAAVRRSQPHDRGRHDHLQGPARAADLRPSEPRGIARALRGRAPNSRSAGSRWSRNTGTYLDSPFHRYADGEDLADVRLWTALADLPGLVVRVTGMFRAASIADRCVCGPSTCAARPCWSTPAGPRHWRTDAYFENHPFLTPRRRCPCCHAGAAPGRHRFAATSTTPATRVARAHTPCSAPASRSSSTCAAWTGCRFRGSASPPCRRRSRAWARFRCARSRASTRSDRRHHHAAPARH